eukprot:gnl/Spiro4/8110_TR4275_c0_g1_i1.p1 gnl/Spiro4/8110_TR4275_c0_g1~~gnl/Spiro4/8110_TR4275_c0_g1_i1.p1  ORF type:complete len:1069 (+),score=211.96 gnl/Spiro4/8110_TR4275_c0_g1_i1:94-3300(+)
MSVCCCGFSGCLHDLLGRRSSLASVIDPEAGDPDEEEGDESRIKRMTAFLKGLETYYDFERKILCVKVLGELLQNPTFQNFFFHCDVVRFLSVMIRSGAEFGPLCYWSCVAVAALAVNPLILEPLYSNKLIPVLVDLSAGSMSFLEQGEAVRAVAHLARHGDEVRRHLVASGIFDALLVVLQEGVQLANHAVRVGLKHYQIVTLTKGLGGATDAAPAAFVCAIMGRAMAALAVGNIARGSNNWVKVRMIQAGIARSLAQLLNDDDSYTRRYAAIAMAELSSCAETLRPVMEAGACVPLIQALRNDSDIIHVAGCIANLALNAKNAEELVTHGSLVPLTDQANKHKKMEILLPLMMAVGNIAQHSDKTIKVKAVESNFVPGLLRMMQSDNLEIQVLSSKVLGNITDCEDEAHTVVCSGVVAAGALPVLANMLRSPYHDTQEQGARVLASLSRHPDYVDAILDSDAFPRLADLLYSGSPALIRISMVALAHLCAEENGRKLVEREWMIRSCVYYLRHGIPAIGGAAARMLASLALDADLRREITDNKALLALHNLSRCDDRDVRAAAIHALSQLVDAASALRVSLRTANATRSSWEEARNAQINLLLSELQKEQKTRTSGLMSDDARLKLVRKIELPALHSAGAKRYTNAIRLLTEIVAVAPFPYDLTRVFYTRAECNLIMGRLPEAVTDASRSLAITPMLPLPLFLRAEAHCALRHYRLAATDLNAILSVDPNNEHAALMLARVENASPETPVEFTDEELPSRSASVLKREEHDKILGNAVKAMINAQMSDIATRHETEMTRAPLPDIVLPIFPHIPEPKKTPFPTKNFVRVAPGAANQTTTLAARDTDFVPQYASVPPLDSLEANDKSSDSSSDADTTHNPTKLSDIPQSPSPLPSSLSASPAPGGGEREPDSRASSISVKGSQRASSILARHGGGGSQSATQLPHHDTNSRSRSRASDTHSQASKTSVNSRLSAQQQQPGSRSGSVGVGGGGGGSVVRKNTSSGSPAGVLSRKNTSSGSPVTSGIALAGGSSSSGVLAKTASLTKNESVARVSSLRRTASSTTGRSS